MNNIFSYYTKYRDHIGEYNKFKNESNKQDIKVSDASLSSENQNIKNKAKAIAEPLILLDCYEHEKAEDAETFFQTYNTELISVTGVLCSFPIAITSIIPFLNKHADKSTLIKKSAEVLSKYKNASLNIAGKSISAPKIATAISALGSGLFYIKAMRKSMESQLGIIRKGSFDATQKVINNHKLFAVLTPEQENQLNNKASEKTNDKSNIKNAIEDKLDITSSFKAVKEFKLNNAEYQKQKADYFNTLTEQNKILSESEKQKASEDKELFESLLKNVEHDVLEPLQRVETISNISYSALFTGGFLEYLITDKLVDILGVKNPILKTAVKIGAPILTYLLLNKNIADIENKAILATKYKHLKKFTEDPLAYQQPNDTKKQSLTEFIKSVYKDMKDYDEFTQNELPKLKNKLEAKKEIELTEKQEQDAKSLQKNTSMVINTQREHLYNQSVGIKALSETILQPIDIIATAIGGKIGSNLSKKCPNKTLAGLMTGLGAVAAFIPAAIIEAKLTKQQKLSEKIAAMLAIKDLNNINKFANTKDISKNPDIINSQSNVFKEFNSF